MFIQQEIVENQSRHPEEAEAETGAEAEAEADENTKIMIIYKVIVKNKKYIIKK